MIATEPTATSAANLRARRALARSLSRTAARAASPRALGGAAIRGRLPDLPTSLKWLRARRGGGGASSQSSASAPSVTGQSHASGRARLPLPAGPGFS